MGPEFSVEALDCSPFSVLPIGEENARNERTVVERPLLGTVYSPPRSTQERWERSRQNEAVASFYPLRSHQDRNCHPVVYSSGYRKRTGDHPP
jgi:hypothetical protein